MEYLIKALNLFPKKGNAAELLKIAFLYLIQDHFDGGLGKEEFIKEANKLFTFEYFRQSLYEQDIELYAMADLVYAMKNPSIVRNRKSDEAVIQSSYQQIKEYYQKNKNVLEKLESLKNL